MCAFYTGKSADGSDMIEVPGVFESPDGKTWSNKPFTLEQINQDRIIRKTHRVHWEVFDHIANNHRTLREEYHLILKKKSKLSRSQREYILNQFRNPEAA